MHVGIDLTPLLPLQTGVDTFIREVVPEVVALDARTRFTLFLNREDGPLFAGRFGPNVQLRSWCTRGRAVRGVFQQALLPVACRVLGIDVLHSPAFLLPLRRGRTRHLLTIHDVTFFTMPELHSPLHRSAAFRHTVRLSAHRADLINVPSEETRRALLTLWPTIAAERVRVTPFGVSSEFCPTSDGEDLAPHRRRLGLPDRYILFVGTIEPRKNIETLVAAVRLLADHDVTLVLAGRLGWGYDGLLPEIEELERLGRVRRLGFVPQADLPWVYRGAALFAYPSLYEGFGFPPLEAMASGIPVVASTGTVFEETLAGAAELVPALDADGLALSIQKLLTESAVERRRRIDSGAERARQFQWRRAAELLLECYRDLASAAHAGRRTTS